MKKVFLLSAVIVLTLMSNAQSLRNNLLNGYKPGDKLEKGVYKNNQDTPRLNTWYGAFNAKAVEEEGPVIGEPLFYQGYNEGGPSINLAGEGQMNRVSVYALTKSNKEYVKGAYYLAFLVNFEKLGARNFYDFAGLDINPLSRAVRGKIFVAGEGNNKIKFGVAVRENRTEGTETYDYNKTHLLVLKVDYDKNQVMLFVDPDLSVGEPANGLVAEAEGDDLKNGLKSIYYRYRRGYKGNIGNFRFATTWDAAIGK